MLLRGSNSEFAQLERSFERRIERERSERDERREDEEQEEEREEARAQLAFYHKRLGRLLRD